MKTRFLIWLLRKMGYVNYVLQQDGYFMASVWIPGKNIAKFEAQLQNEQTVNVVVVPGKLMNFLTHIPPLSYVQRPNEITNPGLGQM